jgi:cobalt transporter subunit CbtB
MQAATAVHVTGVGVRVGARLWPALGILALGLVVLYGVGFSTFERAHNAAHDTRHAQGFPCH